MMKNNYVKKVNHSYELDCYTAFPRFRYFSKAAKYAPEPFVIKIFVEGKKHR